MLTKYSPLYTKLPLVAFLLIPGFVIAKPSIDTVTGEITNTTLIISGLGFTSKANPEPLFWWKADFGETPSALGRKTSWDNKFNGNISTAVVAPGSQKSVAIDFGTNSGGSLSRVHFNSDRLYLHRKTYEDFDVTKDYGIKPGTTLKTFNLKTVRLWAGQGVVNNMYIGAQGANNNEYNIVTEHTGSTTWSKNFTKNRLYQIPKAWNVEELEYKTSSIGIKDGIFNFYQNGKLATDSKFQNRTTEHPNPYFFVAQAQVSNGAQPGSIMYYDSLYLDNTWHRVVICKGKTWATCDRPEMQIPTSWNNTQIEVELNLGGFNPNSSLFLYVVDQEGVANNDGYPLCLKCPLPPTLQ